MVLRRPGVRRRGSGRRDPEGPSGFDVIAALIVAPLGATVLLGGAAMRWVADAVSSFLERRQARRYHRRRQAQRQES